MIEVLEQVEEVISQELAKRGFNVWVDCEEKVDGSISLKTSSFQTVPVLFKSVWIDNNFGSFVRDVELNCNTCKEYAMVISANYETFEGGFNSVKLFDITLRDINGRVYVINMR